MGKAKILFEIPETLRSSNGEYKIIRVHDEVVDSITPEVEDDILTFETDRFFSYALVYNDMVSPETSDSLINYIVMFLASIVMPSEAIYYTKKICK